MKREGGSEVLPLKYSFSRIESVNVMNIKYGKEIMFQQDTTTKVSDLIRFYVYFIGIILI